jgi:putative transposase
VAPGGRKKGGCDAAGEAAEIAVEASYPVATVCRILDAPRSTIYHRRSRDGERRWPGPRTGISDERLLRAIRLVLEDSPFCGEGYRKVPARLRREQGIHTSGKRVLRLMRRAGLLAPQRARRRRTPRPHDGTIIPSGPNLRWGADATMAFTRDDGWVWVFVCVDHYTAEAWAHVSASGDRHAALQPVYDAVIDRWGELRADVGRGLGLRHDWGPQYRSAHFLGSLRWLGIADDASYVGEPECNGCAERWIKTLKEQCLWARLYDDVDDLRQAVATFVSTYNSEWLIQRHGHQTPREKYVASLSSEAA